VQDRLHIITPEGVAFSYEVAGIGSRFAAMVVDTLLQGGLLMLLTLGGGGVLNLLNTSFPALARASPWAMGGMILAAFLVVWGYFPFFEILWNGQTPGKRVMGLRVLRENGTPIGVWEALLRNLLRLVDLLPLLPPYGVGMTVMFLSPWAKRLGDYAAGTVVVREVRYRLEDAPTPLEGGEVSTQADLPLPPDAFRRLRPEEVEMVRLFLKRRDQLTPEARAQLAHRLALSLQERLALPSLLGVSEEALLERLWSLYRRSQ